MNEEVAYANRSVINLAYYMVNSANFLLHRFRRIFKKEGADMGGKMEIYLENCLRNVSKAINDLNAFEDALILASRGDGEIYNDFDKVSKELLALNLSYLEHSYPIGKDAAAVFRLILSQGKPNELLDELSEEFRLKALQK